MNKKLTMPQICCLYYFVLRAGFLGVTSSNILHLAKQDGWISIIIGILLGLIPLLLFLYIQSHHPDDSIFQITKNLFGMIIGKIINGLLVLGVAIGVTVIFYNLITFISSQYLNQTPTLAIAIMFLIAIIYILSKGIIVIARTHVVLLYFGIILFLLAFLGLIGESTISNVKPFLEFGWSPIFKGALSFIAFNVLPLFILSSIPKNKIANNQHYNRNIIITYLLSSITLFITLYLIISIFGPHLALLYQYPEFHLLKLISLAGLISRVEGIIALHWLFDLFAFIVMGIYFMIEYAKTDWALKEKDSNFLMIILCIILVFVVIHTFKNNTIANWITLHISPMILFFFFFLIPFIIFIRCLLLKSKKC